MSLKTSQKLFALAGLMSLCAGVANAQNPSTGDWELFLTQNGNQSIAQLPIQIFGTYIPGAHLKFLARNPEAPIRYVLVTTRRTIDGQTQNSVLEMHRLEPQKAEYSILRPVLTTAMRQGNNVRWSAEWLNRYATIFAPEMESGIRHVNVIFPPFPISSANMYGNFRKGANDEIIANVRDGKGNIQLDSA